MNKHYFLTLEKQIEKLKSKNITINNPDFALERLKNTSYYSMINPYKNCFMEKKETMCDGTKFEHFYLLHIFDLSLSNLLLKYIIHIELELKSGVSYVVAKNISDQEDQYLNNSFYSDHEKVDEIRALRSRIVHKNDYLKHYATREGNIPPWVLIKAVTMGTAVSWLSALKTNDRMEVCEFLLPPYALKQLKTKNEKSILTLRAIRQLNKFRNLAAHGERCIRCHLFPLDSTTKSIDKEYIGIFERVYPDTFGTFSEGNDLYNVIIDIALLLRDPLLQKAFMYELDNLIFSYNQFFDNKISLFLHLPKDMDKKINLIFDSNNNLDK